MSDSKDELKKLKEENSRLAKMQEERVAQLEKLSKENAELKEATDLVGIEKGYLIARRDSPISSHYWEEGKVYPCARVSGKGVKDIFKFKIVKKTSPQLLLAEREHNKKYFGKETQQTDLEKTGEYSFHPVGLHRYFLYIKGKKEAERIAEESHEWASRKKEQGIKWKLAK